jgi:hypothetical protein
MIRTIALAVTMGVAAGTPAWADPMSVLFVGNSYTFGRVDPVMSYNAANVRDLTAPVPGTSFANTSGSNAFEPHPWGGVPGIFKKLAVQAGLNVDVALSTRNAASLRGHMLNTNPAAWDLRGNLALQTWDKVVLQEQSDEPLSLRPGLASNPARFNNYVDKIAEYVKRGTLATYRERDYYEGATTTEQTNNCVAITGATNTTACNAQRGTGVSPTSNFLLPVNPKASGATQVYLYQTWARPNLVAGAFVTSTDEVTGAVTRTTTPATTFFPDLATMTSELKASYEAAFQRAASDGIGGLAGIAPVGEAFQRTVDAGVATRDMWAADATTDGLIDLWFDDGTHASRYGSYLAALTLFGTLTGIDPWSFGANEEAASDLGISPQDALKLQSLASEQLHASSALLTRLPCLHASPRAAAAMAGQPGIQACGGTAP